MELLIVLAFFTLLAVLGPWVGADSRVPGGWAATDPEAKIWPDRAVPPDRPSGRRGAHTPERSQPCAGSARSSRRSW